MLQPSPDKRHASPSESPVLVFDLGGTWLRAGLADAQGRLLRRWRRPTPTGGPPAVIAAMVTAARELDPERTAVGIGIAAPGPLDPAAGMVIRMPNLPGWHDVPLATLVAEALELPARLHNDASLAALGEALAGAGRGASPLVYLTVSTGIGGGIVIGGRLFEGRHGLAGELGLVQQFQYGIGGAGHAVDQLVVGVAGKTMQGGLLLAQGHDLRGNGAVIVGAVVGATGHACVPQGFTQVAPCRESEKGLG